MSKNDLNKITVLIPAYKPSEQLKKFIGELSKCGFAGIIVVDDGSGKEYTNIFEAAEQSGALILRHAINMGKGRALKTAINHYLSNSDGGLGVVTADADGQHLVKDIVRVAKELLASQDTMVLGSRKFIGDIPLKSRLGNNITKTVYGIVSGRKISDTQTGLRGLPQSSLEKILRLRGEFYDYEMNMLMELKPMGLSVKEIEIETVYINDNENSHFNPIKDSWRIYRLILGFGGSSFFAFLVDFFVYTYIILKFGVSATVFAVVGARVLSSIVNFTINRKILLSHANSNKVWVHLLKYYILAVCILGANLGLITLFSRLGIGPIGAKIITECILFPVSFLIQKRVVFN